MNHKNYKSRLYCLLLVVVTACIAACTGNFEEINRNKDQATKSDMEKENYIIGSTLKGMQSLVSMVEEHLFQFVQSLCANSYAGYMEATPAWTEKFSTYNWPSNWLDAAFKDIMTKTYPYYRDIHNQTDDPVALAMADVLRVSIMHRLTDMFGPIPYTKTMETTDESLKVGYDSQEEAYDRMFAELDAAIAVFAENTGLPDSAFAKFDNVYFGNISRWLKYANSLKLRMSMRLSYVDYEKAKRLAGEAIAGGVIEANADNATHKVEENRAALIYNDWKDHRIGADILSYMNGYKDPRREAMFTKVDGNFYGMRIGIDPIDRDLMILTYSNVLITDKDPYIWMNAAEVTFLRAEYELRWGASDNARTLYEKAIRLSFEERGVSGADGYISDEMSTPLAYTDPLQEYTVTIPRSNITICWSDAEGSFEQNLERIITQKWIAIFPLGMEAWAEQRRTGYPKLLPVVMNKSGNTVNSDFGIRRLPYPADEYKENGQNLQQAIVMLGGPDNGGTRVWWDCKNFN